MLEAVFFLFGSICKQLAGVIPQRDSYEPDLTAEAGWAGPFQPAPTSTSLPVQLQGGLEQLQPTAVLECRMPYG